MSNIIIKTVFLILLSSAPIAAQEEESPDSEQEIAVNTCRVHYTKSLVAKLNDQEKNILNVCMEKFFEQMINPDNFLAHQPPIIPEYMFDLEKMRENGLLDNEAWG